MKIVRLKLETPYRYGEDSKEKREEDELWLNKLEETYSLKPEETSNYVRSYLMTSDAAVQIMSDVGMHSHGVCGVKSIEMLLDTYDDVLEKFTRLADKLSSATLGLQEVGAGMPGWNVRCDAPLSGPVLHRFNDLLLLEECCTDELQQALNKGWRLVSVNPQESRRPDYVLGRYVDVRQNPNSGAAREA